jgi:hypothetical protein
VGRGEGTKQLTRCHSLRLYFIIFYVLNRLFFIKSIHTIIFLFMSACLIYILYCGITETYNLLLLLAISAIVIEGIALLINRGRCPLTTLIDMGRY